MITLHVNLHLLTVIGGVTLIVGGALALVARVVGWTIARAIVSGRLGW